VRRLLALLAGGLLACTDAPEPAPRTEFIVVAADSVFWVRSEAEGIRVRSAPMLLAQLDGRFHELYVTDDDRSYYDATFLGQSLYARDLISGDSTLLLADTLMPALAEAYGRAHPDERPLTIEEEGAPNPRIMGTADIGILDVHGPWVSFDYLTDVDAVGARSRHGAEQGVLDLRTGRRATLAALVGPAEAARLRALGFEETSFHLDAIERDLAVHFTQVQRESEEPAGVTSIDTEKVLPPDWWPPLLPQYADSVTPTERRWTREGFALRARPTPDGAMRVALALVDDREGEWLLGTVPAPLHRVLWVDPAIAGDSTRTALTKAFNEAALYSEEARVVSAPSRKGTSTVRPSFASNSSPVYASRASRPRSLASRE